MDSPLSAQKLFNPWNSANKVIEHEFDRSRRGVCQQGLQEEEGIATAGD